MTETSTNKKINMYPQLDNGIKYRLNAINIKKYYFIPEICKREIVSKILSKNIAKFYYFDKFIGFISNKWYVSIASFDTVIDAPV